MVFFKKFSRTFRNFPYTIEYKIFKKVVPIIFVRLRNSLLDVIGFDVFTVLGKAARTLVYRVQKLGNN